MHHAVRRNALHGRIATMFTGIGIPDAHDVRELSHSRAVLGEGPRVRHSGGIRQLEHLQHRGPAHWRRCPQHRIAAPHRAQGAHWGNEVRAHIAHSDQPTLRPHFGGKPLRDRALIKRGSAFHGNALQGDRQLRLHQQIARPQRLATRHEPRRGQRVGHELVARRHDGARQQRRHHKPVACKGNRRRHHLRPRKRAPLRMGLKNAGHHTRCGGRTSRQSATRRIGASPRVVLTGARIERQVLHRACLRIEEGERTTATESGLRHISHGEREGRGRKGIDSVTTLCQYCRTRGGRVGV